MLKIYLIIRIPYDVLNVDFRSINMMPRYMPFHQILPKETFFPEDCVHIKNTFIYSLTASLWNVNIFFVSQGFKVLEEQHSTCKDLTILFEKLKWILFFLFSPEKSSKNIENSFIVSYWLRDWLNLNHTQNASFFFSMCEDRSEVETAWH